MFVFVAIDLLITFYKSTVTCYLVAQCVSKKL